MKHILMTLGFLSLLTSNAQALKLYLISNFGNVGDHNQVLGVKAALTRLFKEEIPTTDLNVKITSASEIKKMIEEDLLNEKVIVVGSGQGGVKGIEELEPNHNLIICLLSHMFLEAYRDKSLLEKVNFIALPTHVDPEIKVQLGSKLIETIGVSHNRQVENTQKAYETWSAKELPQNCPVYWGVVLGGDAPTPGPEKGLHLFTEEDAKALAHFVAQNTQDNCILVLNGPRTGQHDSDKKEITTVHRAGYSDRITELFEKELKSQGVQNLKVFDFQHGSSAPYNSFDLAVGAVEATNGTMIVPGESTSMISESIDTVSKGNVLVYTNNAMNNVHRNHVASEFTAGRVSVLENYSNINTPKINNAGPTLSAAQIIAERLEKAVTSGKGD